MSVNLTSQVIEPAVLSREVLTNQVASGAHAAVTTASPRVEISLPKLSKNQENEFARTDENIELKTSLDAVGKMLKSKNIDLSWRVDDKTNSIVIKFIERGSNKLIRQVPPEEILRLREHISEILGMIYDTKI